MITFFIIIIAIIAILFICCLIERQIIVTRKQKIFLKNLPHAFNGLKIIQISDLHHREFGENQLRIIKRVQKLNPDIIAVTGDLISRDMRDFSSVQAFCRSLSEIAPVLFSMGNHELDLPFDIQTDYINTLKNAGVHVLINSSYMLRYDNAVLCFTGASLDISIYRNENFKYDSLNPYSLHELEMTIGVRSECTVLLAHNPLIFNAYADWNADLILSGHVHGGVIRLPFIGGLLSPERKFFPKFTRGLYRSGSSQLYVSAGLGKLRLFNPPEINLIMLLSES